MLRRELLKEKIQEIWGEQNVALACSRILDYISESPKENSQRLTFSDFSKVTGIPAKDETLLTAISLLSGRYSVLHWHFVYFDGQHQSHDLDVEATTSFISDGILIDPDTGEQVPDAAEHVYPYFSAEKDYLLQDAG